MVNGALIMAALAARYQRLHPEFYPGLRGELYPEAVKVISPASSSMPISILIIAFIFLWGLWTLTRPMAKEEWGMS